MGIDAIRMRGLRPFEMRKLGFTEAECGQNLRGFREAGEREAELMKRHHIGILFREEKEFPALLREITDPPDFLYYLGRLDCLQGPPLAVVGSRKASRYGQSVTRRLLPALCRSGLVIVSGMAYGIDSVAHQCALETGTMTIGVNPGGLLHLYPRGNQRLIGAIRETGLIVSEFPLEVIPRPHLFPIRNRIISGLARGVLVIEASLRSGSLITARLAVEQNRDVMAVPGNIDSLLSPGVHYLIQQGAKLVQSPDDVLEEFGIKPAARPRIPPDCSPLERKVLDLLGENEVKDMDYMVESLNLSTSEVISVMMGLILKNLVSEDAGGYRRSLHAQ